MPRSIWKGAISFGLVHIPVSLSTAVTSERVDFDWLDRRSMEPVGYKRVNKVTGEEMSKEDIVKGVAYEKGRYVILGDDEIRQALPQVTQTIDIFAFVDVHEIPLQYFDTPYYLSPDRRGGKVYALLRETLATTGKVALANVVLRTRQYLVAVRPIEEAIMMVTLRWPQEVREVSTLGLDESVERSVIEKKELDMAKRLVDDMTSAWSPQEYRNDFDEKIRQLVDEKARQGEIHPLEKGDAQPAEKAADIIDLTELLKKSLRSNKTPAQKKTTRRKASSDR